MYMYMYMYVCMYIYMYVDICIYYNNKSTLCNPDLNHALPHLSALLKVLLMNPIHHSRCDNSLP